MASSPLKIGISGIRGVVGETFTPHLVVQFTSAFATYAGPGDIFICEDARPSGKMIRSAVISALIAAGCRPVDLGVCPSPRMQLEVARSNAAGGIVISAGHNPEDWNALRFVRPDGLYLNSMQAEELLDIYHQGEFTKAPWDTLKRLKKINKCSTNHIDAILSTVDRQKIKKAKFKVVVDTCNGACSEPAAELLEALGCKAAIMNDDPGDPFPHDPEPAAHNVKQLEAVIEAAGFDAGFSFDTAGERLALVTDSAQALPDEMTIALCTDLLLAKKRGPVVTNICTTSAVDDIAKKYKAPVTRTPVGQAYIAETARKLDAVAAGEGSGGVIIPDVQYACDALAAMAIVLNGMAGSGKKLSETTDALPRYVMKKRKLPLEYAAIYRVIRATRRRVRQETGGASLDMTDGIKMIWRDSWLHLRPSNTEPLIRVIAEAKTEKRVGELMDLGMELLTK